MKNTDNKKLADRFNSGKLKWSYVDFKSLETFVKVLEMGAEKYSKDNWKNGLPVSEIVESLLRHTLAILNGELYDKESGLLHTGHIMCNAMFIEYMINNKPELVDVKNQSIHPKNEQ